MAKFIPPLSVITAFLHLFSHHPHLPISHQGCVVLAHVLLLVQALLCDDPLHQSHVKLDQVPHPVQALLGHHLDCPVRGHTFLPVLLHRQDLLLCHGDPRIMTLPPEVTSDDLTAYFFYLLETHERKIYAEIKLERDLFNSKLVRLTDILVYFGIGH